MDILLTVVSGTLVFVLGQLVLKLVIEPIQNLKRTIGSIAHVFIAQIDEMMAGEGNKVTGKPLTEELRRLSASLMTDMYLVPGYRVMHRVFGLPHEKAVVGSSQELMILADVVSNRGLKSIGGEPLNAIRQQLHIWRDTEVSPDDEV